MKVRDLLDALLRFDKDKTVCVGVGGGYRHIVSVTAPDGDAIMIPTIETGQEVDFRWPDVDGPSMVADQPAAVELLRQVRTASQLLDNALKQPGDNALPRSIRNMLAQISKATAKLPDGESKTQILSEVTVVATRLLTELFALSVDQADQMVGRWLGFETEVLPGQFDYPSLRVLVDDCVRTLNTLVVAHTKEGLDMPARLWASIEQADTLVNSVQDAIPVRTIVRYPAYIDVYVESDAAGENCRIVRTAAIPRLSDASAATYPDVMPFVLQTEGETAGEQALEFTNVHVPWPDPKLES